MPSRTISGGGGGGHNNCGQHCQHNRHHHRHHHGHGHGHGHGRSNPTITEHRESMLKQNKMARNNKKSQQNMAKSMQRINNCNRSLTKFGRKDNNPFKFTPKNQEITSDMPTVYLAPNDYVHIYHKQTMEQSNPTNQIPKQLDPQDQLDQLPTVVIAPEDYQHIYHKQQPQQQQQVADDGANNPMNTNNNDNNNIDSCQTMLIAPEDYIHIYKRSKTTPPSTSIPIFDYRHKSIQLSSIYDQTIDSLNNNPSRTIIELLLKEQQQLYECYPRCPSLCSDNRNLMAAAAAFNQPQQQPPQQSSSTSAIPARLYEAMMRFISAQQQLK